MGKRYKHLYGQISDLESLYLAYGKAQQNKRHGNGFLVFQEHAPANLRRLNEELVDESWTPDPFRNFFVYEPKQRLISAPTFRDRVVHHSLYATIEPIIDQTFLPWSFACRKGKGTHAGVKFVQAELRRGGYTHFLKTDFAGYFPNIDTNILHAEYRRKISCKSTLNLLTKVIPPDSTGVPIGALPSQLSANVYGNILDQFLHHHHKVRFARYMDDVIVLGYDPEHLREVKDSIEAFAADKMKMSFSHWSVSPVSRGINFLGYRIWPGHKLIRKSSVHRARRKIKAIIARQDYEALERFIGSWAGHINKADVYNLKIALNVKHDIRGKLEMARMARHQTRDFLLGEMLR